LTRDWALPYRAERIVEVLEKQTVHGLAESQDLQRDILSIAARQVLPLMLHLKPSDERARKTLQLLSAWDFEMQRGRPEPLNSSVEPSGLVQQRRYSIGGILRQASGFGPQPRPG
jgi:penicillin amidase